jgi:hypothetical protein
MEMSKIIGFELGDGPGSFGCFAATREALGSFAGSLGLFRLVRGRRCRGGFAAGARCRAVRLGHDSNGGKGTAFVVR